MGNIDYLVIVNDIENEDGVARARDIVRFLFSRNVWVFPQYAGHRRLHVGDLLIVYLAGETKAFVAQARIASEPEPMDSKLREELDRLGLAWFTVSVKIDEKRAIDPPKLIRPLIPKLRFIKDKKNYGLALRQGVRQLPKEDVKLILRG